MSDVNENIKGIKKDEDFGDTKLNNRELLNMNMANDDKTSKGEINPASDLSDATNNDNFGKSDDTAADYVLLFGGKVKIPKTVCSLLRIVVPLIVVAVCAFFVSGKITETRNDTSNIAGRFDVVSVDSDAYIKLDTDGFYSMSGGHKGEWSLADDVFTFKENSGNVIEGRYVDKRYIALIDENYYFGQFAESEEVDVTLTANNGNTILLDRFGNATLTSGASEPQVGTYIIDSSFIVVTIGDINTTFIKCRDGITSTYYQI